MASNSPSIAPMAPNTLKSNNSMRRAAKPSNVQTTFLPSSSNPFPASASTANSSSSIQASPVMSPESAQLLTNNSSIQGSPEGLRGREYESLPPHFELPESIVSRKSSQSAMSEALKESKSPGLIRRISNRASQFAGRRRQSSNTAMRDNSTGPVTMRRRSDSTNTAPEGGRAAFFSSSDEDLCEGSYREEPISNSIFSDHASTTASISSAPVSSTPPPGPVVPAILLQGTTMTKITKNKKKLLTFVLQNEAAKVSWDKSKSSKSFYIDDIKDIRIGADAQNYRREFGVSEADEPRFFSVIYSVPDGKGRSQKAMHLIAGDDQTFDLWTTTLDAISKHRQDLMASLSSFHEKAVKAYWSAEMTKKFQDRSRSEEDENIDLVGVERLCRSLHIHSSAAQLQEKFTQADSDKTGSLNFAEFQEFVKLMKKRDEAGPIYRRIAAGSPNGQITLDRFLTFLRDTQKEDVDTNKAEWEMVYAKMVRRAKSKEQHLQDTADGITPIMNEAALFSYLISTFNSPLRMAPSEYSLDRPLNEYFISSSHNTYLLGRQVAGQSSIEAYISALSRGCKCVEVDCWNGNEGQPVVMHGNTLTTRVPFVDVMHTISKYAFVKSHFPLIVSLEVHCSPPQQAIMAQIIKDTCGDKLVTSPIEGASTDQLPTPQQLMGRILIKVKQPKQPREPPVVAYQSSGRSRGSSLSSPYFRPADASSVALLPPPSPWLNTVQQKNTHTQYANSGSEAPDSLSSGGSDSDSLADDVNRAKESNRQNKTSNIITVLGELGVYSAGLKFNGFDDPKAKTYNHIFSFMEKTFDGHCKTQEEKRAMAKHNMRYLMRIYPNGWRVASTNFDPLKYWRRGVQMVALNWQTHDLGMQLNDAMFAGGEGESGYVLKPLELREIRMLPTLPAEAGVEHIKRERKNVTFSIDMISAQQLMRPKWLPSHRSVDPYIEFEVYHADDKSLENRGVVGEGGLDASSKNGSSLSVPHRRRTQIIKENGFNPVFDKKFNFHLTTKYPDLVFVRWSVKCSRDGNSYNEKDAALATYTAKLSSLQEGYRTLPLLDTNGDRFLFSTLFCCIKIEPLTSIYVNQPESTENISGLKSTVRTLLSRAPNPMSPKLPVDNNHQ